MRRARRIALVVGVASGLLFVSPVTSAGQQPGGGDDAPTTETSPPAAPAPVTVVPGSTTADDAAVRDRWAQLDARADAYAVRAGQQAGVIKVNLGRALAEMDASPLSHAIASPVDVGAVQALLALGLTLQYPLTTETLYPAGAADQYFDDASPGADLDPLVPVAQRALYAEAHSRPTPAASAYTSFGGANTSELGGLLSTASGAIGFLQGTIGVAAGEAGADLVDQVGAAVGQVSEAAAVVEQLGQVVEIETVASRSDVVDHTDGRVTAYAVTAVGGISIGGVIRIGSIVSRTVATFDPDRDEPIEVDTGTDVLGASVSGVPVEIGSDGIAVADTSSPLGPVVSRAVSDALSGSDIATVEVVDAEVERDAESGEVTATSGGLHIDFFPPEALASAVNILTPMEVGIAGTSVTLKAVPAEPLPAFAGGSSFGSSAPTGSLAVSPFSPLDAPAVGAVESVPSRPGTPPVSAVAQPIGFIGDVDMVLLWLVPLSGLALLLAAAEVWRWNRSGPPGSGLHERAGQVLGQRLARGESGYGPAGLLPGADIATG